MKITKTKLKEIIKEEVDKFIGPRLAGSRASLGGKRSFMDKVKGKLGARDPKLDKAMESLRAILKDLEYKEVWNPDGKAMSSKEAWRATTQPRVADMDKEIGLEMLKNLADARERMFGILQGNNEQGLDIDWKQEREFGELRSNSIRAMRALGDAIDYDWRSLL